MSARRARTWRPRGGMSRTSRRSRLRRTTGCVGRSGSGWPHARLPRRVRTPAGTSSSCVLSRLATEYVAVFLAVPCAFAEPPLAEQILANPPDHVLRYLVEHLQIPRHAE